MKRLIFFVALFIFAFAHAKERFDVTPLSRVVLKGRASDGAVYEMKFSDAQGLVPLGGFRMESSDRFRSRDGSLAHEFEVPTFARSLEVRALKGSLENLSLTAAEKDGFLNVNARFTSGNLSGYARSIQCANVCENGTNALVVAQTPFALMQTDEYAVRPGCDYEVTLDQQRTNAVNVTVRAVFRDSCGRIIDSGLPDFKTRAGFYAVWAGDGKCHKHRFRTLPGASSVSFSATAGRLTLFGVREVSRAEPLKENRALTAAKTEIIVPADCGREILFAARELRHWLEAITGRAHPVYHEKGHPETAKIILGTTGPEEYCERPAADDCDVFRKGRDIYIAGRRESGVITGVFQLLERNTDIIFPRPNFPGEAKFTPNPALVFTDADFKIRPTWDNRSFGLGHDRLSNLWQRRNYINSGRWANNGVQVAETVEYFPVSSLVYEFGRLVSNEKYFESHPEYFAEIESKRTKYGSWGPQLCYTSEGGRQAFVRELFARLEKDLTPAVKMIHLAFADSGALCSCRTCRAPIQLPDGTSLAYEDPAYRSTQYYLYVNKIVEDVKRRYPLLGIETLGYIAPARPPKVKIHPELHVVWCPYPKNDANDLRHPKTVNVKWAERSHVWPSICSRLGIYEYWGDAMCFPRAVATAAAENLRLWNSLGVHEWIYTEAPCDTRRDKPSVDAAAGAWDVSAMELWTLTRLMLDSTLDPVKLRREYLRRTYGPAASAMREYYETVQGEWLKSPNGSMYNENPVIALHMYVREKGHAKFCRQKLDEAAKKADDPRVAELVRLHRVRFEWLYNEIAQDVPDDFEIPDAQRPLGENPISPTDPVWMRALALKSLSPLGRPREISSNYNAKVSLIHDGEALHVRFVCSDDDRSRSVRSVVDGVGYPCGERVELMVGDGREDKYRHFALGRDGVKYSALGYNHRRSSIWQAETVNSKKGWVGLMRIPLKEIGIGFPDVRKLKLLPIRADAVPGKGRYASFAGRWRHAPRDFQKAELVR